MLYFKNDELTKYVKSNVSMNWNRRDFLTEVERYMESKLQKVLLISGLRGVGKTVGLLQAVYKKDAIYITAQKGEVETADDYLRILRNTDTSVIVLDEYSWIKNREDLDAYLFTMVQNGKRVIVTGTESIIIENLRYGELIHRTLTLHVTYFSFSEYCRLNNLEMTLNNCESYLKVGGLFEGYVLDTYGSMFSYIKSAVINNLVVYCGKRLDQGIISAIVYTILYKAVCPSTVGNIPVYHGDVLSLGEFLDLASVDAVSPISEVDFDEISTILAQTGIIAKIQNYRVRSEYRTYVMNPSITYQLIRCIYNVATVDRTLMGYMFESACMCLIDSSKLYGHKVYYLEGRRAGIDFEVDAVVIDESYSHNRSAWLFESKLSENTKLPEKASLVSNIVSNLFADFNILGRYVIYNGANKVELINGAEVIYGNMDEIISYYREDLAVPRKIEF